MSLGALDPAGLLALLIVAATPILLAATGELVAERAGVLNLGVEGIMIMGAVAGFAAAAATGNPWAGMGAAAAAGAAMAALFALLVLGLLANQVATGLALTLFGIGLSALVGHPFVGQRPPPAPRLDLPGLTDLPVLGRVLFGHDALVYAGLGLVGLVWAVLRFTRAGLILRAVGENHDAAHALGHPVRAVRLAAVLFGGACAGLGGAHLSLVRVPQWQEGMTAGAGWIALALVVFAAWKPWRVLFGAWLFGGVTVLQLNLQALGVKIPAEVLAMSPYVVTILVLVLISAGRGGGRANAPAMLGRPFHASS